MRVLMISDVYFPRINGVSTSIQTFSNSLRRQGHQVTLIAPHYPGIGDDEPHVIRVPSRYLPMDPEDRMMRLGRIMDLVPELRTANFDVLHIQTPFVAHYAGLRLAKALNIPTVETYHTFFEEYLYNYLTFLPRSWLRYAARAFSRSQGRQVDALIVPSTAMLEVLRGYGIRNEGYVLPTGLELDRFDAGCGERFRDAHGIEGQRPTLVHVGRVAFEKNIGFLLEMLVEVRKTIPGVLLVIAGEGPAKASLQRQAVCLGLEDNVLFVGYLSRADRLLDCYRAGDGFVFASRTETQGLVLLEAMALGVPVVSTAVMGTRDILAPGKGALVAEEQVGGFAAAVVRLLTDAPLRNRLAREGREYARSWGAEPMAERMIDVYGDLITMHATGVSATLNG